MELKDYVRSIPDFPKEGILFRGMRTPSTRWWIKWRISCGTRIST